MSGIGTTLPPSLFLFLLFFPLFLLFFPFLLYAFLIFWHSKPGCLMFPYENLEVYKKAFQVNQKLFRLIKSNKTWASYIKNQLGRSGLSIMLNIAEGSAKYSSKDRSNYFITARGSAFECCSIISFLHQEKEISEDLKNTMYSSLEEICRILFVMIKNLKN